MPCQTCTLQVKYYNNNKIKSIYCSPCQLRIHHCKECQSTQVVWDGLDIVCTQCGLIHETTNFDSDTSKREDLPVPIKDNKPSVVENPTRKQYYEDLLQS